MELGRYGSCFLAVYEKVRRKTNKTFYCSANKLCWCLTFLLGWHLFIKYKDLGENIIKVPIKSYYVYKMSIEGAVASFLFR